MVLAQMVFHYAAIGVSSQLQAALTPEMFEQLRAKAGIVDVPHTAKPDEPSVH